MAIQGHNHPGNRSYPSRNEPCSNHISPVDGEGDFDFNFNFNSPQLGHSSSLNDPSSGYDHYDDSPADRLFVNGVLLPHQFQVHRSNTQRSHRHQVMMSCTSSCESRMGSRSSSASTGASSLASSRSSSTDRGSPRVSYVVKAETCSRGRTGTNHNRKTGWLTESWRWHVIATPVPGMSTMKVRATPPSRRRTEEDAVDRPVSKKKSGGFLRGFVSTCKQCHALEVPPRKDDGILRRGTGATIY